MIYNDNTQHNKPHFHVFYNEYEASVGISWRMVQKYEAGVAYPHVKTAGKLAYVLQIDVDDLLGNTPNTNDQLLKNIKSMFKNKKYTDKEKKAFYDKVTKLYKDSIKKKCWRTNEIKIINDYFLYLFADKWLCKK